MIAADVMVSNVITVDPESCVQDVADVLLKSRISAVPVVDKTGALLGIVSESDLMRRTESGTERRRSAWLDILGSKQAAIADFVKARSRHVVDVMTRDVVTVTPTTPLSDVAALLERKRIKRVPVMKGNTLVGIVSRSNLLQALASLKGAKIPEVAPPDAAIRKNLLSQLVNQSWAHPSLLNVTVHDGTVDLWGVVDSAEEKKAVHVLAETVAGVRAVNDNIMVWPVRAEG